MLNYDISKFSRPIWMTFVFLLILICSNAVEAIQLTIIDGNNQITPVGQQFEKPFTVKLTDDNGAGLPNAPIYFENNGCAEPLSSSLCPPLSSWGHYETGETYALVYTDNQGIAVSPIYIAGGTPSSGLSIIVAPSSGEPPYNFPSSEAWNAHKLIYFQQIAAPPIPVPMLTPISLTLLILIMVFLAYKFKLTTYNELK